MLIASVALQIKLDKFGFKIDNLTLTELDMIPFYDYADVTVNDNNINFDIQIPYVATAPFIDYADTDFSFIDSVAFDFSISAVVPPDPGPPILPPPDNAVIGGQ